MARAFVRSMACGHPDYGVEVNLDKSSVNFDVQVSIPLSSNNSHLSRRSRAGAAQGAEESEGLGVGGEGRVPSVGTGERTVTLRRHTGREIAWCGLLIDCQTLQVRRDYDRYVGLSVRDAVTIGYDALPGMRMRDRTVAAVKAKLLPILLDSSVNSPHRLRYNLYQAVVFGALVMGAHASGLNFMFQHSGSFLMRAVEAVVASVFPHMKALEGSTCLKAAGFTIHISKDEVEWLSLHAFLTVIQGASFHPLRRGRTRAAIEHTVSSLESLLASLESGSSLVLARREWLVRIVRAAYNAPLRSLRC